MRSEYCRRQPKKATSLLGNTFRYSILASMLASVVACGSGGGGGGSTSNSVITGTAASGAAIAGKVTLKDANGQSKTVNINSDGKYAVDVSGLAAPYVLIAKGKVGTRTVSLVSAATEADVSGNVNITPFTDLVIANIAGQVASNYFEGGDFSALNENQLSNAKTLLTQRLLPMLTAMGISESFDFLKTTFKADHSGFDAFMDVVSVEVDVDTGIAIIRDIINNTRITDDLADPTDAESLPAPAISPNDKVDDIVSIRNTLEAFWEHFSSDLPAANSQLESYFSESDFLDSGTDLDAFLADITTQEDVVGISIANITIKEFINSTTTEIAFNLELSDGSTENSTWIFKNVGGIWKIIGDQHSIAVDPNLINFRHRAGNIERIFEFYVDDAAPNVHYFEISGPGLSSPLVYKRNADDDGWVSLNEDGEESGYGDWVWDCGTEDEGAPCVDLDAVGDNSNYTIVAMDINQQPISTDRPNIINLPFGPISLTEVETNAANLFGLITSISPSNPADLSNGETITVDMDLPSGQVEFEGVQLWADSFSEEESTLNSDGSSVDFTWAGAAPSRSPQFLIWMKDSSERRYVSDWEYGL